MAAHHTRPGSATPTVRSGEDDPLGIGKAISAATQVSVGAGLWLLTLAGLVGAATAALIMLSRYRAAAR
ncbi:hypothetical protein A6A27_36900 [Micromonospora sp. CB01531]|nr:hypothetical protein A6A27_36900 [Micromonospora sp. CB01531]